MGPSSMPPSGHRRYMLQGRPLCGLHMAFYGGRADFLGMLVGVSSPFRAGYSACEADVALQVGRDGSL